MNKEIFVFADWEGFAKPALVGTLRSAVSKNKEHFSFSYDNAWLQSTNAQKIDPQLELYSGDQHSLDANNFRVFLGNWRKG